MAVGPATLAMVLHLPAGEGAFPCVLACHGLGASKDSDKYLMLAAEATRAGLALARFDFRGCGESSGVEAETTVATRIADAEAVAAALDRHPRLRPGAGLLGSSLGGFVALHVAARLAGDGPVVTWNAPAALGALSTSDAPGLGRPFLDELAVGHLAETPSGVRAHLVVHGEADDVVPLAHGVRLHARAAAPRDLLVIAGADHRLTDLGHRSLAAARSVEWLVRFLRDAPERAGTCLAARGATQARTSAATRTAARPRR